MSSWPMSSVAGAHAIDVHAITIAQWNDMLDARLQSYEKAVADIAANPQPATFDNTLKALEEASCPLNDAFGALFTIQAHATPEHQELLSTWRPIVSTRMAAVMQNDQLYSRLVSAHTTNKQTWSAPQEKLYADTIRAFKRAGAGLNASEKAGILLCTNELARLEAEFEEINLANNKNTIDVPSTLLRDADEALLSGCVRHLHDGVEHVAVPVSTAYIEPLLEQLSDRPTRQHLWEAWTRRGYESSTGDRSTKEIIHALLHTRQKLASLLSYPSWGHMVAAEQMAKTPEAVFDLLNTTWDKMNVAASKDIEALTEFAQSEGFGGSTLEAWDLDHYTEAYRRRYYDIDSNAVKQYFSLEHVRQAAFDVALSVFGVSFVADQNVPKYHPDTVGYRVEKNGESLGTIIFDDYVRATKASGAWMNQYATGHRLNGGNKAAVINVLNIPTPLANTPTLLSFSDAVTLFHELGHALHGLLGQTAYPSQAGTDVVRDFVELPSQILENWVTSPQALGTWARHWQTNEPMPKEMIERLLAAQNFAQAIYKTTYLQSAWSDAVVHTEPQRLHPDMDVFAWEQDITRGLGAHPAIMPRHHLGHFSHVFGGGYSFGYYSYLWAEVLEADAFARFKEEGLDSQSAAQDLTTLYTAGGSADAMELFIAFRKRPPTPDALFERLGITAAPRRPTVA